MARPALEVADIFRDHGAAWRTANAGHVSLGQLKVMAAIERCRTAALGGHVARCEDCSHTAIAYNSCRNRHCPKCQGAAAKEWLADRAAELLPVPYFHVVFTLPAAVAAIAYPNKAVIYDLLFKASAETLITIAADPKHHRRRPEAPRRQNRHHLRAAHLGLGHDPPSARSHDRARRWSVGRRPELDLMQAELLPARPRAREAVPAGLPGEARRCPRGRSLDVLRRPQRPLRRRCVRRLSGPAAQDEVVRLRQAAVRRARGGARLPVPLYPPRRPLERPADRGRQPRSDVHVQGLQARR